MSLEVFNSGSLQDRYQYFSDHLFQLEEEPLKLALEQCSGDELFSLSKFAVEDLTDLQFPQGANAVYERFLGAFGEMNRSKLSEEQFQVICTLVAMRQGLTSDMVEGKVRGDFELALTDFLGAAEQIDEVGSLVKAKDVAYALFAGPRNLPKSSYSKHLARLVQVGDEATVIDLIKLVMLKFRKAQVAEFTARGFAFRQKLPAMKVLVAEEETVAVSIPFGSRAFKTLNAGEFGNIGYNGGPSAGIPVYPDGQKLPKQLQQEAINDAGMHFDDPIILVGQIAQGHIIDGHISYHVDISQFSEEAVSLGEVVLLEREDLAALYPGTDPALLLRLDKLLFGEVVQQQQPVPQQPHLQPESYSDSTKKLTRGALTILAGFVFYKYVGRDLYIKGKAWWDAKPLPAVKTH